MTIIEATKRYFGYRSKLGLSLYSVRPILTFQHYCEQRGRIELHDIQDLIYEWCESRDTESGNSTRSRVYPIITFIEYLNSRGLATLSPPSIPEYLPRDYKPHAFSREELVNFFKACDEIKNTPRLVDKIKRIQIPVIFRLLYSTGVRTIEARFLLVEDIDFNTGIVRIKKTKGYSERIIVLHDSMKELLFHYNSCMNKLMPNRKYLFANIEDKPHLDKWISKNFHQLWHKYNTEWAIAYHFRHNYAIQNINNWHGKPHEVHEKIVALSKSMGHSVLESTLYYYSLVPELVQQLNNNQNDVLPVLD